MEMTLNSRAIERLLKKPDMEYMYDNSLDVKKKELQQYVAANDLEGVRRWYTTHPMNDLESLSLRELRRMARKVGVLNYCRKTKYELMKELANEDKERRNAFRDRGIPEEPSKTVRE